MKASHTRPRRSPTRRLRCPAGASDARCSASRSETRTPPAAGAACTCGGGGWIPPASAAPAACSAVATSSRGGLALAAGTAP
eukprot:1833284-Pleurochrysis_carterae.AAC.1